MKRTMDTWVSSMLFLILFVTILVFGEDLLETLLIIISDLKEVLVR